MKKLLAIILSAAMICGFAVPVMAGPKTTDGNTYLKGTGVAFDGSGWNGVNYLGGTSANTPADGSTNSVWHLVYTGKDIGQVTSIQVSFTNGSAIDSSSLMVSTNAGGKNPGWVIVAPYNWEIDLSNSYLATKEAGNIQFNISGYSKGTPPPPISVTYTVIFVGYAGQIGGPQTVADGSSAIPPTDVPAPTGKHFVEWDKSFDNVTGDLVVNAVYADNYYDVIFVGPDGQIGDTQSVKYGDSATAPADPVRDGYVFDGWDTAFDNVTQNLTVTAKWIQYYAAPMYSLADNTSTFTPDFDANGAWRTAWGAYPYGTNFNAFTKYDSIGSTGTDPVSAGVIWSEADMNDTTGEISVFNFDYNISGDTIVGGTDFNIAADNGFIMFINGTFVKNSNTLGDIMYGINPAYADATDPNAKVLTDLGIAAFESIDSNHLGVLYNQADWQSAWQTIYTVKWADVGNLFHPGNNTITIIAYNTPALSSQDVAKGANPAGFIFAGTVYSKG